MARWVAQRSVLQHLQLLPVLHFDHDQRERSDRASQGYDRSLQGHQERNLPAVSFVKPSGWVDGHPASSKIDSV